MLPTSAIITLFIVALILFIFAGIRMRIKQKMSLSEIALRYILFIIFFVIMMVAVQFLNTIAAIIVVLIDIAALYGVVMIYRSKNEN